MLLLILDAISIVTWFALMVGDLLIRRYDRLGPYLMILILLVRVMIYQHYLAESGQKDTER